MHKGLTSYGDQDFSLFLRKAFIKGAGYTDAALSRPVIAITDTGSDYNPCHGNAPQLIDAVKRGVMLAGGLPMVFPTISIHESFAAPTSMFLRNLMAIDTEEMIRAQPMDAVVLVGGCDKTVPAQLMGAASANLPAIQLITGSMLTGSFRGERVGACTDCRRLWAKYRAGEIDDVEIEAVKRGVMLAGGLPMEFPTISLHESFAAPTSIGPVTSMIAGTSALAAAINCAGTVLSQPPISTTESIGWARTISSVSIAIRLRRNIEVGWAKLSCTEIVGKAIGRPPASITPRLTASISCGALPWQGL